MGYWQGILAVCCLTLAGSVVAAEPPQPGDTGDTNAAAAKGGTRAAQAKTRLWYSVVCGDQALQKKLEDGVVSRFQSANVEISNRLPLAQLILFVMRDENSNVNKAGVTISTAYVSDAEVDLYTAELIKSHKLEPSALLVRMLREPGFLIHLDAAHLDEPSDIEINQFLDYVVNSFVTKMEAGHRGLNVPG